MKKMMRTLSLVLAVVLACMPLVSFADASGLNESARVLTTDLDRVTDYQFQEGGEYVILGDDDGTAVYALTTNPASSYLSTARIPYAFAESDHFGFTGALLDACVWIAVEREGRFVLRNKMTGRYLGSLTGVYSWDSIYGSDYISITPSGFYQGFYGPTGYIYSYMLNYNKVSNSFYLTNSDSNCNVHIYAVSETAVVMPVAG